MTRKTNTLKMIKYLENRINCENVMEFASRHNCDSNKCYMKIDEIPVFFEIIKYNKNDNMNNLFTTFDLMTKTNHTDIEIFPYIYGVLNCNNDLEEINYLYIYYEPFNDDLNSFIKNMNHISDWYSLIFGIALIEKFQFDNEITFQETDLKNILFRKLSEPKKIKMNDIINVTKFIFCYWSLEPFDTIKPDKCVFFEEILRLINNREFVVEPSKKIVSVIEELANNPTKISEIIEKNFTSK